MAAAVAVASGTRMDVWRARGKRKEPEKQSLKARAYLEGGLKAAVQVRVLVGTGTRQSLSLKQIWMGFWGNPIQSHEGVFLSLHGGSVVKIGSGRWSSEVRAVRESQHRFVSLLSLLSFPSPPHSALTLPSVRSPASPSPNSLASNA